MIKCACAWSARRDCLNWSAPSEGSFDIRQCHKNLKALGKSAGMLWGLEAMFASPPDDAAWLTRIGCGRFSENFCGSLWESGPGWAGVKVVHVARWGRLFGGISSTDYRYYSRIIPKTMRVHYFSRAVVKCLGLFFPEKNCFIMLYLCCVLFDSWWKVLHRKPPTCGGETWGTDLHLCVAALFDPASRGFGHQLRAQGLQIRSMVGSWDLRKL